MSDCCVFLSGALGNDATSLTVITNRRFHPTKCLFVWHIKVPFGTLYKAMESRKKHGHNIRWEQKNDENHVLS